MSRQIVLIFSIDDISHPEACGVRLHELADDIQEAMDVTFELRGEDEYFSEKQLTHMIIREMDGEDEKEIITRRYEEPKAIEIEEILQ